MHDYNSFWLWSQNKSCDDNNMFTVFTVIDQQNFNAHISCMYTLIQSTCMHETENLFRTNVAEEI